MITNSKGCFKFSMVIFSRSLRRQWSVRVVKASYVRRWRRTHESHCVHFLLLLLVDLLRRDYVLRIHLSHDELAQHLDLLDLCHCQFITHLHGLQIAEGGLVL
jgi:hypothetical protein